MLGREEGRILVIFSAVHMLTISKITPMVRPMQDEVRGEGLGDLLGNADVYDL